MQTHLYPVSSARAGGTDSPTADSLVSEAMSIFDKTEQALPCSRLALTAHEFNGLVSGRGSIASFLRASPTEEKKEAAVSSDMSCQAQTPSWNGGVDKGGNNSRVSSSAGKKRGSVRSYFESDDGANAGVTENAAVAAATATNGLSRERTTVVGGSLSTVVDGRGASKTSTALSMSRVVPATMREGAEEGEEASSCPQCNKSIDAAMMREHLDFHFAEGLQERYSREGHVTGDMAAVGRTSGASNGSSSSKSVEKRRRDEGGRGSTPSRSGVGRRVSKTGGVRPTARIDSFFKPL